MDEHNSIGKENVSLYVESDLISDTSLIYLIKK